MRCFLNSPTRTKMTLRPSSSLPGSGTEILKFKASFLSNQVCGVLRLFLPKVEDFLQVRVSGVKVFKPIRRSLPLDTSHRPEVVERRLRAKLTELGVTQEAQEEGIV